MKKILKVLAGIAAAVLLVVIGYLAYVLIDYHRIDDMQALTVTPGENTAELVAPGVEYTAITYNIGFGAYSPEYSFFMDGGKSSRAASRDSVLQLVGGAADYVRGMAPDFLLLEEVDYDSTRSYHVDQKQIFDAAFPGVTNVSAVNYDSPYLMVPPLEPHGKSLSGLVMYSRFPVASALRRQLPITTSLMKLVDLDRCYMVARLPMTDGRELVMYTIHMTAYSSDASVRDAQLRMLVDDMTAEIAAGNPTICGGDFNMEMLRTQVPEGTAVGAAAGSCPLGPDRGRLGHAVPRGRRGPARQLP